MNLSVSQLQHDLIEKVRLALDDSGLAPDQLELEITESGAMRQPEKSMLLLEELRRTGVRMSLDDFGTGHSSLSYLKRFPIDTIKIDQSFVRDLGTDRDTAAIVTAIIAIGHKLGLRVVAEGVERGAPARLPRRERLRPHAGLPLPRSRRPGRFPPPAPGAEPPPPSVAVGGDGGMNPFAVLRSPFAVLRAPFSVLSDADRDANTPLPGT